MERMLDERTVSTNPFDQFQRWWEEVLALQLPMTDAMALATSTRDGKPSVRMVLLKGFDERGFVFYTNFNSRKGRELADNPQAALLFHWRDLERQVRIEGSVHRVGREESESYFATRPRESQISAVVSRQSEPVESRAILEAAAERLQKASADRQIPCPPYWGGFRVAPDAVEFWQNRPARLHDRILYTRKTDGSWLISRLAP